MENKIRSIMATLRCVSVEGPENWRRMAAVYQALDEMQYELAEREEAEKQPKEE